MGMKNGTFNLKIGVDISQIHINIIFLEKKNTQFWYEILTFFFFFFLFLEKSVNITYRHSLIRRPQLSFSSLFVKPTKWLKKRFDPIFLSLAFFGFKLQYITIVLIHFTSIHFTSSSIFKSFVFLLLLLTLIYFESFKN